MLHRFYVAKILFQSSADFLFFNYSLLALLFEKIFQGMAFKDLIPAILSFTNGFRRSFWSTTQFSRSLRITNKMKALRVVPNPTVSKNKYKISSNNFFYVLSLI